jgi:hypothetical protein
LRNLVTLLLSLAASTTAPAQQIPAEVPALDKACAARDAQACLGLARVYKDACDVSHMTMACETLAKLAPQPPFASQGCHIS